LASLLTACRRQLWKVTLTSCFATLMLMGLPSLSFSEDDLPVIPADPVVPEEPVRAKYSTDLNVHQLPSNSERFIHLSDTRVNKTNRKSYGLRWMAQGGTAHLPGMDATSSTGFSAADSVIFAPMMGVELEYTKKLWGGSFIFDVSPAGVPFSGSSSVTSQINIGLGAHYISRWFQKRVRWNFIFYPYTSYFIRYSSALVNHKGMGLGVEAHLEAGKWQGAPIDLVFALNWNRMAGTFVSSSALSGDFGTPGLLGTQGGTTQLIYALVGIEMNFSLE